MMTYIREQEKEGENNMSELNHLLLRIKLSLNQALILAELVQGETDEKDLQRLLGEMYVCVNEVTLLLGSFIENKGKAS